MYFLLLPILCLDALIKTVLKKNYVIKKRDLYSIDSFSSVPILCYAPTSRRALSFSNVSPCTYTFFCDI